MADNDKPNFKTLRGLKCLVIQLLANTMYEFVSQRYNAKCLVVQLFQLGRWSVI